MTTATTRFQLQAAHQNLPKWLNAWLACQYAKAVPMSEAGANAIHTTERWIRGEASEQECIDAAQLASKDAYDASRAAMVPVAETTRKMTALTVSAAHELIESRGVSVVSDFLARALEKLGEHYDMSLVEEEDEADGFSWDIPADHIDNDPEAEDLVLADSAKMEAEKLTCLELLSEVDPIN